MSAQPEQIFDVETNGFEWNILPWEVLERIITFLSLDKDYLAGYKWHLNPFVRRRQEKRDIEVDEVNRYSPDGGARKKQRTE